MLRLIDTVLTSISLLIIPCMIVYVTNKQEPWTLNLIANAFITVYGITTTLKFSRKKSVVIIKFNRFSYNKNNWTFKYNKAIHKNV